MDSLFICRCCNTEHQLIFSSLEDEVYLSVHLVSGNFWNRLKNAFWYVLGYKSIYGDFDEFIFKKKDAGKLQKIVDYLNNSPYKVSYGNPSTNMSCTNYNYR